MVNDNEYVRPTMPYYQYYQQPVHAPVEHHEIVDERTFYFQPQYEYGGGYVQPAYYPPYMYGNYAPPQAPAYVPEPPYTQNFSGDLTDNAAANRVMQHFMDENGQIDIPKMLKTVGQFADTIQQVSPVIKQLNDLVRSFRA